MFSSTFRRMSKSNYLFHVLYNLHAIVFKWVYSELNNLFIKFLNNVYNFRNIVSIFSISQRWFYYFYYYHHHHEHYHYHHYKVRKSENWNFYCNKVVPYHVFGVRDPCCCRNKKQTYLRKAEVGKEVLAKIGWLHITHLASYDW